MYMSIGGAYVVINNSGYEDSFLNRSRQMKAFIIQQTLNNAATLNPSLITDIASKVTPDATDFQPGVDQTGFCKDYATYLPKVSRLEQSTTVFLNSSYKPYATVGQQYFKKSYSGPQWGSTIRIALDKVGQFICDPVVHVRIEGLAAVDPRDRVKYFDMPGMRLFNKVSFESRKTPLDSYYGDYYNIYYKQHVPADKKPAFEAMMGQQKVYSTWLTQDPTFDLQQQRLEVADGAQTFKQEQDALDLWIPLLFFFKDYKNALPQYLISWGQVEMEFQLNTADNLIAFADNGGGGAYVTPRITTFDLYINNLFTDPLLYSLMAAKIKVVLFRPLRQVTRRLTLPTDSVRLFDEIKWPTQLLEFAFMPLANAGISTHWTSCNVLSKQYIRVPVLARDSGSVISGTVASVNGADLQLTAVGLSATPGYYTGYYFIVTGGRGYQTSITANRYTVANWSGTVATITPAPVATFDTTTTFDLYIPQLQMGTVPYYRELGAPVDSIHLRSDNVDLLLNSAEDAPSELMSEVVLWKTHGLVASRDGGILSIAFGFEQDDHSPSGHFSFSASGESYLDYKSSYISADNQVNLFISSRALNLFYIGDGTTTGSNVKLWFP